MTQLTARLQSLTRLAPFLLLCVAIAVVHHELKNHQIGTTIPEWQSRYLANPPGLAALFTLLAVTQLIAGGGKGLAGK